MTGKFEWPASILSAMGILFVQVILLSSGSSVRAQEASVGETSINHAYSVFTGTGKYRVSDRTIYVLRLPFRFRAKKADYSRRKPGVRLILPVAVGVTYFDDVFEIPGVMDDDLQTLTAVPGAELELPLTSNWRLSPFAQAGLGLDLKSSNNSLVWGAGSRTRAWFGEGKKWLVGGEALVAGNHPLGEGDATRFGRWSLGAEYKWQTDWEPFGRRVSWHARLIQYYYSDVLELQSPLVTIPVNAATEVGASFGIDPPLNIFGYKFRQGGVAYEYSGNFKAIKLITRFPF